MNVIDFAIRNPVKVVLTISGWKRRAYAQSRDLPDEFVVASLEPFDFGGS
jgi:hypothetical protein